MRADCLLTVLTADTTATHLEVQFLFSGTVEPYVAVRKREALTSVSAPDMKTIGIFSHRNTSSERNW